MADVAKRLGKGTVSNALVIAYTVPSGTTTMIKAVTLCNTSSTNVLFTLILAGLNVINAHTIKANDTITIPFLDQVLHSGETIEIASGSLNYYISGKEVTP
ncbi:hypothetical protein [Paenibacillus sp. ISL-20]|uniref:hypothetical protein n=1 Tax=Paenibacillus sp. ISL-20 TaxID=2819163 RepID=UPI001BEACB7E|nr:hypothetical protein [Paenibacillus sp. ISL-20]MBT2761795.1 hypothetical protein [Paenibacillus sp. ISL-20]